MQRNNARRVTRGESSDVDALLAQHNRTALYEVLYRRGYHQLGGQINFTHAEPLIKSRVLRKHSDRAARDGVHFLDVGCSQGRAVQMLWESGFRASGIDIAPTAVRLALQLRRPPRDSACGGDACFKAGSAAMISWPDGFFDGVISTDVLEHIPPPLVPRVVAELTRVTKPGAGKSTLFLAIAAGLQSKVLSKGLFNGGKPEVLTAGGLSATHDPMGIHETREGSEWWRAHFAATGQWACEVVHKKSVRCDKTRRGIKSDVVKASVSCSADGEYLVDFWLECERR